MTFSDLEDHYNCVKPF